MRCSPGSARGPPSISVSPPMRAGWREVEPLREVPTDRPAQAAILKTWKETQPR